MVHRHETPARGWLCRNPLAWAAHGLALWDVLTSPEAPSSVTARLRVAQVG